MLAAEQSLLAEYADVIALIGVLFGGAGIKFAEKWLYSGRDKKTYELQLRDELRDENKELRDENRELRDELDGVREEKARLLEELMILKRGGDGK